MNPRNSSTDADDWSMASEFHNDEIASEAHTSANATQQPASYRYYKLFEPDTLGTNTDSAKTQYYTSGRNIAQQYCQTCGSGPGHCASTCSSRVSGAYQRLGSSPTHTTISTTSYISAAQSTTTQATVSTTHRHHRQPFSPQLAFPQSPPLGPPQRTRSRSPPHNSPSGSLASFFSSQNTPVIGSKGTASNIESNAVLPCDNGCINSHNPSQNPSQNQNQNGTGAKSVGHMMCPRCDGVVEKGSVPWWGYAGCILMFPIGLFFLTCAGDDRCPSCGWVNKKE